MDASHYALVVPANLNQTVHVRHVELGGGIERIVGDDWFARLSGSGSRSAPNVRAEVFIREAGIDIEDAIYGTVIFLGHENAGVETDVPRHLIRLAEQLFDMPLAA